MSTARSARAPRSTSSCRAITSSRRRRPSRSTLLLNLYTYNLGFGVSRFGVAAAAAVIMVVITFIATAFYVRTMIRVGEEAL